MTLTDKQLEDRINEGIKQAMTQLKTNGNGRITMPRTLWEFLWQGAQTFGVPAAAFGVILLIVYQTFPAWIEANIATQVSLTKNLDEQSDNLNQLSVTLDDVARYSRETEVFRKQVTNEHKTMEAEVEACKVCGLKLVEEHKQRQGEHKAIVNTLQTISEELKKQ